MNTKSNSRLFILEALKTFKTQGAFLPSSNHLSRRMIAPVDFKQGMTIVELGAGIGTFTAEIVKHLPSDSKLLVFEINTKQAELLRKIFIDPRVIIIEDDAVNLAKHLNIHGAKYADHIISGLPLGNFSKTKVLEILQAIEENLSPRGSYIQFQYLLADWLKIRKIFKAKIIGYEVRNFPPAFLYKCHKKGKITQ